MADKPISGLNRTTTLDTTDLFVLEQSGQAKAITAESLLSELTADWTEHGGIVSITKTGTSGNLGDVYTILYADETTSTFTVTNGDGIHHISYEIVGASQSGRNSDTLIKIYLDSNPFTPATEARVYGGLNGLSGISAYCHIKYAAQQPTSDAEMHDYADAWMGVATSSSSTAPTSYSAYKWYNIKGATGDTGATGAPGADGAPGEAGARSWLATSAPISASGVYVFDPSSITIPSGVTALPQKNDMIWWQNNYYYITSIAYSNNQVNAYGCALGYSIVPDGYINMVYYSDYGIDYSGRLQEAWEGGKALFCVMPQTQQDDPQNILTLTNVTENYQGGSGDTPHTRFIFSAVHHTSNGNVLEVAISGDSAINSWSTATYSLSGGGGSDDIYWVTYGTTTSAQIEAAYQSGKMCLCLYGSALYVFSYRSSATNHTFCSAQDRNIDIITCNSNTWSASRTSIPLPQSTGTPAALGTAARGTATAYARADHVHPKPSASDVGAIAVSQGVGNAGKFCVVGNDGNATFVTMSAWSAGSY